jgi:hypothetical protein
MKNFIVPALAVFMFVQYAFAQSGEFEVYDNGLIYSKQTMQQLATIVDSLNTHYDQCDLSKSYHAKYQTLAHTVRLDSGAILPAKADLDAGISFEDFVKKYPQAAIERDVLVVKSRYANYKDEKIVEYSQLNFNGRGLEISYENEPERYDSAVEGTWLYTYNELSEYSKESLKAFYFPNEFESKPLAQSYSQMIGYADCIIDTTVQKFKDDTERGWLMLPHNWEKLDVASQKLLLDSLRSIEVVGFCSMDSRPRDQAIQIAKLSAATASWKIFFKAHLDIMNDRFHRASDGSYAWARRKTYIRELEELNIDIKALIFGISLRIENHANNHYHGNIWRLGRALSETQNRKEIEDGLASLMQDDNLDGYNRAIASLIFYSFVENTQDEALKLASREHFEKLKLSLPAYLKKII